MDEHGDAVFVAVHDGMDAAIESLTLLVWQQMKLVWLSEQPSERHLGQLKHSQVLRDTP